MTRADVPAVTTTWSTSTPAFLGTTKAWNLLRSLLGRRRVGTGIMRVPISAATRHGRRPIVHAYAPPEGQRVRRGHGD